MVWPFNQFAGVLPPRISLGCGRITCLRGDLVQLVHIGFGIVIGDRCRLVLVGYRDLGNTGTACKLALRPIRSPRRP